MKNSLKTSKCFTKSTGEENVTTKIIIGIMDDSIKIIARENIDLYKGHFNLNNLQEKDRYFKMYDKIEDAYDDIITSFSKNNYELIKEGNHLIINLEIEVNYKKNIISLILERNEIKNEDLIKSLYEMASKYIKENSGLKSEIKYLKEKINIMDEKIDFLYNHVKTKENYFDRVFKKCRLLKDEKQVELVEKWISPSGFFKCKLIYDAKEHGDKVSTFHSLCDNKGATLTIISTSDNKIFGGYLSMSFSENSGWIHDEKAFVFSLNYNEKYESLDTTYTFYGGKDRGPTFGGYNIEIFDSFLSIDKNRYNPYSGTYNFHERYKGSKDQYFTVNDLQVYQIYD
jgi:hypothetical protein